MAWIDIATFEGEESFGAYLAEPQGNVRGAIVVIQEIFGVNPGIRAKCDKWAQAGYLAVAPDLFWRFAPRVELDPDLPDEFQQALDLMGELDQDGAVRDIEAAIRASCGRMGEGGKVGCVGYCLGGKLAYMAAARTDVDASVGFYPVGLPDLLGERNAIGKPLMLHIAQEDHFVPKEQQAAVHAALDGNPHVTIHDYPGVDHGFAAETGKRRVEDSARVAEERTAAFFAEHVGREGSA
jgi:carboxymethylenebutenolidase